MPQRHQMRLGATLLLLCTLSNGAFAQQANLATPYDLESIHVLLARVKASANRLEFTPRATLTSPAADGGALLSTLPGVSGSRMGGLGLDIVIRGQQGNQLNIIAAGSFTYGGCLNRMDPPTSTLSLVRADRIIVERGYSSVTNGPGGPGGTVRIERDAPAFEAGKSLVGSIGLGGATNSDSYDLSDRIVLLAGVENVFDEAYSIHLSRGNDFDTTVTRVMEPGRTIFLKAEARF